MMHPFYQFINTYTSLSIEDWGSISSKITAQVYPQNTLILEQGKVCKHLYFLESGLLRFFVWREGNDISKFFTESPFCFTSQKSFTNQVPAQENIETLEPSRIWQMKRSDAYALLEIPAWAEFVRELMQNVQNDTEEILEALQTESARERYVKMLEENNPLLQRIPLKYLASYLGIAPQSLSRIRKKIMQQK